MRIRSVARVFLLGSALLAIAGCAADSLPADPVEEQLRADHVTPGSALEKLIRDNQDFSVLDPSESANDGLGIPLWQRVMHRRSHPDQVFAPGDPTGGYPRVLKNVHSWMVTHQDLNRGPVENAVAPDAIKDPGADQGLIGPVVDAVVNPNLRISGSNTSPRSESAIAMNFANPSKIIAASNANDLTASQAQFYSTNGGSTWGQTRLPFTGNDDTHSNPMVDWTSDGTAWSMTLGIVTGIFSDKIRARAYKSTDSGKTWTLDSSNPSGNQTNVDSEKMWVDHSATSPYKDTIYATWHNGSPVYVGRRSGGSWQTPLQISGSETTGTGIGGDIKTNSAGEVFAFWPDTGSSKIYMRKSTNGGASFGSTVTVRTTYDTFDIGVPSFASRRAFIYVTAGAYKTATKNLVYATWTDLSGAAGCTAPGNEPNTTVASTCKTRIWFSRSTDGGSTWSAAVKVNDQASTNDQYNQWLAVDETTGRLGLVYYDTVGNAGRLKADLWYQSSADDGVTWSAATKVTTAMTDETVAAADPDFQYGDYNGLTGNNGVFFPSWTDRRNTYEEIWTAKITEPTPVASDACSPAAAAMTLGSVAMAVGTTVGKADNIKSYCGDTSAATAAPDAVYAITLPQTGTLKVDVSAISAGFNPAVYIQSACGTDYYCSDFGATSESVYGEFPAGTYYIVVDGSGKTSGSFTLNASFSAAKCGDGVVNTGEQCDPGTPRTGDGCGDPGTANQCKYETPVAGSDTCPGEAVAVGLGTKIVPVNGVATTNGYTNDYSSLCAGYSTLGADHVYAVTPSAGGTLTVSVGYASDGTTDVCASNINDAGCWDRVLYARTTCTDVMTEVGCSDKGAFDVETISFAVTSGKTYYVFVDGYDDQYYSQGPYNLVFKLQ